MARLMAALLALVASAAALQCGVGVPSSSSAAISRSSVDALLSPRCAPGRRAARLYAPRLRSRARPPPALPTEHAADYCARKHCSVALSSHLFTCRGLRRLGLVSAASRSPAVVMAVPKKRQSKQKTRQRKANVRRATSARSAHAVLARRRLTPLPHSALHHAHAITHARDPCPSAVVRQDEATGGARYLTRQVGQV